MTPEQAEAVSRGLAYLAMQQNDNGSWTSKIGYKLNEDYNYTSEKNGHVGVTALAGMAFLAGGHLPGRGEYGANVERCLDFVLGCVDEDGYISQSGTRMYSHAFATLFLAEIYGMTHREDVRDKLQKAIDFIVKSQNAEGGWRYEPYAVESDMSIVVCQVLALRAARNIGIRVPKSTVDKRGEVRRRQRRHRTERAAERVPFAHERSPERDRLLPLPVGVHSRSSFPLTAAGVTALHGLGIYSDESIQRGIEYLVRAHLVLQRAVRQPAAGRAPRPLLLLVRPLLRRAGDVHDRQPVLGAVLRVGARGAARHPTLERVLPQRHRPR